MQIMESTASDPRLACREWKEGMGNFRCAARLLEQKLKACGRRLEALAPYNGGPCRRSPYALEVYRRWFSWSPKRGG